MKTIYLLHCCLFIGIGVCLSCTAVDDKTLLHYARAKELYSKGQFSGTADLLADMKNFAPALSLRAKAEYFQGNLDKAESSCRRAIKRRPGALEAKLYLARILHEKGETQKAERVVLDLLSDNPSDVRALRFASALDRQQGRLHSARLLLDQAAECSAEGAMVLLDRARMHWVAGRGDDALEDLSRANAMLPWDTPLVKSIEHLESLIREAVQ